MVSLEFRIPVVVSVFDRQDGKEWSFLEFRFKQPTLSSLNAKFYAESDEILSFGHIQNLTGFPSSKVWSIRASLNSERTRFVKKSILKWLKLGGPRIGRSAIESRGDQHNFWTLKSDIRNDHRVLICKEKNPNFGYKVELVLSSWDLQYAFIYYWWYLFKIIHSEGSIPFSDFVDIQ